MASSSTTVSITGSLTKFVFRAPEEEWLGDFTRLEVYRSRLSEGGPFEEVTGPAWSTAKLSAGSSSILGPLVGTSLELETNGVEVTVTFTGVDPLTRSQIAAQIAAANPALVTASVQADNSIQIETIQVGAVAYLKVLGGDAAPLLGLDTEEPGSVAFGQDPRIALIEDKESYSFSDPHGSPDYWYRTRYSNHNTATVSEYTNPIPGKVTTRLDPSNLIIGTLTLADAFGRPQTNTNVLVHVEQQFLEKAGTHIMPTEEFRTTDDEGYVEFPLVRGLKVRVSVEGSQMVKEITVPTDAALEEFDLFDPDYTSDDPFKVQTPKIDYATRRTL